MATNRTKTNSVYHRLDKKTDLCLRQTNEKVTTLFHKIHNLQVEVASLTSTIKAANVLWLAILERPEDRLDAAMVLAAERQERIERFKKE